MLDNKFSEFYVNTRLKVIIAHIGFLWQNDNLIFEVLSHPNIYGDLTGQFSSKTKDLIINLKNKVTCNDQKMKNWQKKDYWSTKIMMGTDYNYFEAFHIVDQLLYFFSEEFYDLIQGNLSIIENIFSRNILNLLPNEFPTHYPNKTKIKKEDFTAFYNMRISNECYANFFKKMIENLNTKLKNKNPVYFRMDPMINYFEHYSDPESFISNNFKFACNSLENQFNFFFQWKESPLTLAGTKLHRLNCYFIYIFQKNNSKIIKFDFIQKLFEDEKMLVINSIDKVNESLIQIFEKIEPNMV